MGNVTRTTGPNAPVRTTVGMALVRVCVRVCGCAGAGGEGRAALGTPAGVGQCYCRGNTALWPCRQEAYRYWYRCCLLAVLCFLVFPPRRWTLDLLCTSLNLPKPASYRVLRPQNPHCAHARALCPSTQWHTAPSLALDLV